MGMVFAAKIVFLVGFLIGGISSLKKEEDEPDKLSYDIGAFIWTGLTFGAVVTGGMLIASLLLFAGLLPFSMTEQKLTETYEIVVLPHNEVLLGSMDKKGNIYYSVYVSTSNGLLLTKIPSTKSHIDLDEVRSGDKQLRLEVFNSVFKLGILNWYFGTMIQSDGNRTYKLYLSSDTVIAPFGYIR